ncbi:MAG: sulfatase-like hydrolase/transferase, partial [Planctomycetota bacterium]|nr:sulfatase-like hydrolase/transferase [Planctomycetota bacterium]
SDNGACYEWGPFGFDGPSRRGSTTLHEGEELERIGQDGTHQSYGSGWAMLGNTPLNLYKHFAHEGGISSPLLARWPAGLAARSDFVTTPAHIMDVAPTVLEAAGVAYPSALRGTATKPLSGISLLPAMRGEPTAERSIAYEHQLARGLRRGRWKIVWGKRMPKEPAWELYDLENDRAEQQDLAAERPGLVEELVREWEAWAKRVGADPFPLPDAPADPSLRIDGVEIIVRAEVEIGAGTQGVVIAQGGRVHGFSLHVDRGTPVFEVRRDGVVQTVRAPGPIRGVHQLRGRLTRASLDLSVDGKVVSAVPSPGLLPGQPTDAREVGVDSQTAAGSYESPNRFGDGRILSTNVRTR